MDQICYPGYFHRTQVISVEGLRKYKKDTSSNMETPFYNRIEFMV